MREEVEVNHGSDNIFTDLGLPNPEERMAKAVLSNQIHDIIKKSHLTQARAAALLGIDQPKVSALIRGRLSGFSMERLFYFLNALGRDVDIVVKPKPSSRQQAHLRVAAA